eukprot:scaffold6581_cov57-Attheya_sp.AAC.5
MMSVSGHVCIYHYAMCITSSLPYSAVRKKPQSCLLLTIQQKATPRLTVMLFKPVQPLRSLRECKAQQRTFLIMLLEGYNGLNSQQLPWLACHCLYAVFFRVHGALHRNLSMTWSHTFDIRRRPHTHASTP